MRKKTKFEYLFEKWFFIIVMVCIIIFAILFAIIGTMEYDYNKDYCESIGFDGTKNKNNNWVCYKEIGFDITTGEYNYTYGEIKGR